MTRSEPSFHNYLIPRELPRKLPEEQIILVQAETFVDQKVLRGKGGRRVSHRQRERDAARRKSQAQTGKHSREDAGEARGANRTQLNTLKSTFSGRS